jgi:superfamily II DNA or RNA helicase
MAEPKLEHGIIMSGIKRCLYEPLQVASIDTVNSWYVDREELTTERTYDFLVFDEIHAQVSKFRTFLKAHNAKRKELGLSQPYVLGLSATPQHKELNKLFHKIVLGPTPGWLIENGYLSPFRYFQGTQGNLSLLKKNGDDYTEDSVAAAMEGLAGDLVKDWKRLAEGRATVGFFPRRSQAYEAMELLRANGIDAHYVDGETDDEERRSLFARLNNGEIQYLCNVGVVERGTDIPRIGCVQLCTAIGNVVRYRQMVGRGSRVHPEVSDCIVLDHANNIRKHGFFEDDINWTLEWGERPAKTHAPKATVECPSCGCIYRGGTCRNCGYTPEKKVSKSNHLEFSGGELHEVTKKDKKERKKKTNEQIMISALFRAGKRGATWNQAWILANQEAKQQGTEFITPSRFFIAGKWYRTIPYGHPDAKLRVRQTYGFTVGKWSKEDNPYRMNV